MTVRSLTLPITGNTDSHRLGSAKLVIIGGLAELFSGAISMGLDAYLAAVTERDHYICEEKRERDEVASIPQDEEEIYEIMDGYGVRRETTRPLVGHLERNPEQWIRVHLFTPHLLSWQV